MNTNVLDKLTYGLFVLSSKKKDKVSGCIIDACIQVGTNPDRILVSVMNSNYTRKIIEKSGVFCIAILDEKCPFDLIKHFGYQSSKDVNKFEGLTTFTDINGVPCILSHICASISAKVVDSVDLDSHTFFIGEIKDQKNLSNTPPMTYSYYQKSVKPKPDDVIINPSKDEPTYRSDMSSSRGIDESVDTMHPEKKIIGWRCTICGSIYNDPVLPNDYMCGVCGHPSSDFVPIYE